MQYIEKWYAICKQTTEPNMEVRYIAVKVRGKIKPPKLFNILLVFHEIPWENFVVFGECTCSILKALFLKKITSRILPKALL